MDDFPPLWDVTQLNNPKRPRRWCGNVFGWDHGEAVAAALAKFVDDGLSSSADICVSTWDARVFGEGAIHGAAILRRMAEKPAAFTSE